MTRLPRAAARVSLNRSKLQRALLLSTLHRSQNILTSSGFCSILLLSGDYRAPSQYFYTGSVQHRPQPARPWQGVTRTSPSPCSLSFNSACQSWMSSPPLSATCRHQPPFGPIPFLYKLGLSTVLILCIEHVRIPENVGKNETC